MIGMFVDVFLRDHWRLGRIIAFDPISHYHLLLYAIIIHYHHSLSSFTIIHYYHSLSFTIIIHYHHSLSSFTIIITRMASEELEVVELTECYWILRSKQDVLFEVLSLHRES